MIKEGSRHQLICKYFRTFNCRFNVSLSCVNVAFYGFFFNLFGFNLTPNFFVLENMLLMFLFSVTSKLLFIIKCFYEILAETVDLGLKFYFSRIGNVIHVCF